MLMLCPRSECDGSFLVPLGGLLEGAGDAQHSVFGEGRGGDLETDRQTIGPEPAWHRYGGQASDVERIRQADKDGVDLLHLAAEVDRLLANPWCRNGQRGRDQRIHLFEYVAHSLLEHRARALG